ncbi:MAG: RbsD/FucU family protein [Phycisphaerae bacterium]|jgi:L-fucose mutarotase
MLKKIPTILPPKLVKILMEMGHGDELVIADGNFPASSIAAQTVSRELVRMDGHGCDAVLAAILELLPLDQYVERPVALMELVSGDTVQTPIWDEYRKILTGSEESEKFREFEYVERFAFYERAKKAYAIAATGETALYANIILKKGVV